MDKYMSDNTGRIIRPVKKEVACIPLEMGEMAQYSHWPSYSLFRV